MPLYEGPHRIGICQRCGFKRKRVELVEDGYLHKVLVCYDTCFDEDHPQRYPPPTRIEGEPPLRPSPENIPPPTAPVLSGHVTLSIMLDWTASTTNVSFVSGYTLYRSVDGGTYAELFSSTNVYDAFRALVSDVREYDDSDIALTHTYAYYVVAHAEQGGDSAPSNILLFEFSQATSPVLTAQVVVDHAHLTWTAATVAGSTIESYDVYRDDGGGFELIGETDGDVLTLDDFDIHAGGAYDYYVIAIPVDGVDSQSNTAHIDVSSVAPSAVVSSIDMSSCTGPTISWTASVTDPPPINAYAIWRSANGGAFSLLHTNDGVTLSYQDATVSKPGAYSYYVIAHSNSNGDSIASNTVSGEYLATETILVSEDWVSPNGCWTSLLVEAIAGGGGGETGDTGNAGDCAGGNAGGGGEFRSGTFSRATVGSAQSVTIGPGGIGGALHVGGGVVAGRPGQDGGDTSFGTLLIAKRGRGGATGLAPVNTGGTGGSGGDTHVDGGDGGGGGNASGSAAGAGSASTRGGGGGGGGGGRASSLIGAAAAGGNGGTDVGTALGGAAGASSTDGSPGNDSAVTSGGGGGGGGGVKFGGLAASASGAGGNGGKYGAGGGGAGGVANGTGTASAGGNGHSGMIKITYNY